MRVTLESFSEEDPSKKDADWGNSIVSHLRMNMRELVSQRRYRKSMEYLFGEYEIEEYKKIFKDPENSGVTWVALAVMEKLRNTIIAENENAGVHVNLTATDPTAVNQKSKDKKLLAARRVIEAGLSGLSQSIGGPPITLAGEKGEDGKPIFKGDVDTFDKMGLDDSSMEDINYYFATYYRLMHEIQAENPINYYFKFNEVAEDIALYVNDILAVKAIANKVYVDEITGALSIKYLLPTSVRVWPGKRRDFKDASAIGYQENVSIKEFIRLIGNEFDLKNDVSVLLQAANAHNGTQYTGITDGGKDWIEGSAKGGVYCSYSQFLEFQIPIGYIEWKSNDATSYKIASKNTFGNFKIFKVKSSSTVKKGSMFVKHSWYEENTYKAYYVSQSGATQKLYKYGRLTFQQVEGAEDEYSSFSISAYREKGKSATEVAKPFIRIIEKAFKKLEHMVAVAKPDGRAFHYESLVKIAQHMFPDARNKPSSIQDVIKLFYDGSDEIYTTPLTNEGKPIGGGGTSSYKLEHGLSNSVKEFINIVNWAFMMFNDQLGTGGVRTDSNPDPRDGFKLNMQALASSQKATQYIRSMLMSMLNNDAKRLLSFVDDIVKLADKDSPAYKHLLMAVGDACINDLANTDAPLHRMGIFVEALNTQMERDELMSIVLRSLDNQQISVEQYLLIKEIRSPKLAAQTLAYQQRKNERIKQQEQAAAQQAAQQSKMAEYAHLQQMETIRGQSLMNERKMEGEYRVLAAKVTADAMIQATQLKNGQKTDDIESKKIADLERREKDADLESQKSLV